MTISMYVGFVPLFVGLIYHMRSLYSRKESVSGKHYLTAWLPVILTVLMIGLSEVVDTFIFTCADDGKRHHCTLGDWDVSWLGYQWWNFAIGLIFAVPMSLFLFLHVAVLRIRQSRKN